MRAFLYLIVATILFSCQNGEQKGQAPIPPSVKPKVPAKMYAGSPDLPENEQQITSAGIGKIVLGDPLSKVDQLYDSVADLTIYKSGGEWPAKKIFFGNQEWILAESVNAVNQITGIYTNRKSFSTKYGYHIGMPYDSLDLTNDSLTVHPELNGYWLGKSGIYFKTSVKPDKKKSGKKKKISPAPLSGSVIEEFFIICGDC